MITITFFSNNTRQNNNGVKVFEYSNEKKGITNTER